MTGFESAAGPSTLVCRVCETSYHDRWRCECGAPLEFTEPPIPDYAPPDPADFDTRAGLWAFTPFLPVERRASLGEGLTPLVEAPKWDAEFKLEYVFPTGSFKDRGAAMTVSRGLELGIESLVEDSSGNAGAAIATYAARAGVDAKIFVPASVKDAKLRAIHRAGAEPVRIKGTRDEVTAACIEAVESGDDWYASHAWRPSFLAGTATFAYETALQRDWTVPDAVVAPVGHGTLFLGAYRGFRALKSAGWTDDVPRMLAAQAAGYAPIVSAIRGQEATTGSNELADGIQIRDPVRKQQIVAAIDDTNGDAISIGHEAVESELKRLHQAGFYTEPTCAIAPAALRQLRNKGVIKPGDEVTVPLTGSGLKGY